MSNMKMVSLIDAEAAEAKTEARARLREEATARQADLEHAASAIADELLKINNMIAEQKISIATLQYDFATLRFEVDELKRQQPIEPSRESAPC
jgi:uncharacterized coiled-coil protein SlyX